MMAVNLGTKGTIDFHADKEPVAHLLSGSPFDPVGTPRTWVPITTGGVGKPEPISNLGRDMAEHVTAGRNLILAIRENRAPLVSATDARATVEMICAVFESHRLGGQRVNWPLKARGNPLVLL